MKIIQVKYTPTPEILEMMSDYRDMTNHLLAYALHKRITHKFDLQTQQRDWFETHYRPKYASHYLHSACSYAMFIVNTWRKVGKSRLPYLHKSLSKLDQELFRIKEITNTNIKLEITIRPYKFIYLDLPIHHKKWQEYSQYKLGEITIHPDCIDLPFQVPDIKRKTTNIAGVDLNFNHADIATSRGKIKTIDLSRITEIQQNMKRKRESVQKSIPTNLKKQYLVLGKYKNRERNRVKQVIINKSKEISKSVGASNIIFEDLSKTQSNLLIKHKNNNKQFKNKLSSWVTKLLQEKTEQTHKYPTYYVYPQGTSSHCAFDNRKVKHPKWNLSVCDKHGTLDRDKNASVNILERGRKYLRGEPFPPSVWQSLLEQSVHDNGKSSKVWHENRNDAMTKDTINVNKTNKNTQKRRAFHTLTRHATISEHG